ncbi:MAG: type 1 glutamine amidotransferase domain-containing protein [Bdellovibrionota bacterium]
MRVAVLASDGFEDSELTEPIRALREEDASVTILSPVESEWIQAFHHHDKTIKVAVDGTLGPSVRAEDFDAVVLPGGALNADQLRADPQVRRFVQEMNASEKPIAAICHAPWILVSAGLVRGRKLTSYFTIQDDVRNAGGEWLDGEVIGDNNWVTSRMPKDLPAFNSAMIELFARKTPLISEETRRTFARARIA